MTRRLLIGLALVAVACSRDDHRPAARVTPVAPVTGSPAAAEVEAHRREVDAWHQGREERLRREDGWLSLVGLFWLEPGDNTLGSAADNDIAFPAPAPPRLAVITVPATGSAESDRPARARLVPAVELRSDGQPLPAGAVVELLADTEEGGPTVLEHGTLRFNLIERGGRLGVRVKDSASPARAGFKGVERYPVSAEWRVEAALEPYQPPRTIDIPTVLGTVEPSVSPGAVVFTHGGKRYRLDAVEEEPGAEELFLIFGDDTNRDATYGAGRFLYVPRPDPSGRLVVDFNRAYNPPCAFSPYATCPLPPPQNKLALRVEAGEKRYGPAGGPAH